jgi:hypothetical protein
VYIKKTIKLPDGSYTFEGEVSADELDVLVTAGINYLVQQGALPLIGVTEEDLANLQVHQGKVQ